MNPSPSTEEPQWVPGGESNPPQPWRGRLGPVNMDRLSGDERHHPWLQQAGARRTVNFQVWARPIVRDAQGQMKVDGPGGCSAVCCPLQLPNYALKVGVGLVHGDPTGGSQHEGQQQSEVVAVVQSAHEHREQHDGVGESEPRRYDVKATPV